MNTALITGANKSIGFEVARLLAGAGYHVFLGSRDKAKGEEAVARLVAEGVGVVEAVVIDVCSEDSVRQAHALIAQRTAQLDVLINNAGIPGKLPQAASTMSDENLRAVFETNFFAPVRVIRHFIDLLKRSQRPRIVNVTSDLASLTLHNDPQWPYYAFKSAAYGPSKTALNAYTVALAYELRDTAFKVNAVNPGYTATAFNNFKGPKQVTDAAAIIAAYGMIDENAPTGKFISDYGETPW